MTGNTKSFKDQAEQAAGEVKTGAQNAASDIKTGVQNAAGEAKARLQNVAGQVTDAAGQATRQAGEALTSVGRKANDAVGSVGHSLQSAAENVRTRAPHEGPLGYAATHVADALDQSGKYLEREKLNGLAEDATDLVRRYPIPAILLGFGLGFLVARSTSSRG